MVDPRRSRKLGTLATRESGNRASRSFPKGIKGVGRQATTGYVRLSPDLLCTLRYGLGGIRLTRTEQGGIERGQAISPSLAGGLTWQRLPLGSRGH